MFIVIEHIVITPKLNMLLIKIKNLLSPVINFEKKERLILKTILTKIFPKNKAKEYNHLLSMNDKRGM